MKTLLLTKEEVASVLNMDDTIEAVAEGYRAFNSGKVMQPEYFGIAMPEPRGEIDFKGGYYSTEEVISLKASSGGFAENETKYGVPKGMGTVLLWDARTCALTCVMDGSLITGFRTGAAGAVSVRALARKNASELTSIGTGTEARMEARAISRVAGIKKIHAWDLFPESSAKFKEDMESELGIPVTVEATKREAVEKADILVSTTRGKGSVIEADWVQPGTHIVAIGTDSPGKQEYDPEIFRKVKLVNDSKDQCVKKGETQHGINEKIITRDQIHAELGEILLGEKTGRESDDEITMFDSTGMAIQDNTTANLIYKKAKERGLGTYFEFFK
jgi:Predicted ornithine cyclodeaminase, mu-crystallin homolog